MNNETPDPNLGGEKKRQRREELLVYMFQLNAVSNGRLTQPYVNFKTTASD